MTSPPSPHQNTPDAACTHYNTARRGINLTPTHYHATIRVAETGYLSTFVMARITCVLLVEPPARALWSGVFLTLVTMKT
nr:MAG TPA: hypothetical protein [Caudoviricetes sp.]